VVGIIGKFWRANTQLSQELGREASPEDLADELRLPLSRVAGLMAMARQAISLDAPMSEDSDASVGDFIEDKTVEDPSDSTASSLLKEKFEEVLADLGHRERRILELRFGLADGPAKTLEEISRLYGVTRERIRQLEVRALRKLRHPSRIRHLQEFMDTKG
jgi:RNA polymerase primary sigma factor